MRSSSCDIASTWGCGAPMLAPFMLHRPHAAEAPIAAPSVVQATIDESTSVQKSPAADGPGSFAASLRATLRDTDSYAEDPCSGPGIVSSGVTRRASGALSGGFRGIVGLAQRAETEHLYCRRLPEYDMVLLAR